LDIDSELIREDKEISEELETRYFITESSLHGYSFCMGISEFRDQIERRIRETMQYIEDAEKLAGV
jgi:hypothetical protein